MLILLQLLVRTNRKKVSVLKIEQQFVCNTCAIYIQCYTCMDQQACGWFAELLQNCFYCLYMNCIRILMFIILHSWCVYLILSKDETLHVNTCENARFLQVTRDIQILSKDETLHYKICENSASWYFILCINTWITSMWSLGFIYCISFNHCMLF